MKFAVTCLVVSLAPCLCFPVKFSGEDCGASAGRYQSFDVTPSTPHTGQVFKVTNHFTFDEDVSGGQFDVKVTALGGITLKHQTGPLCGFDTSYDVYLAVVKVASVTIYGSKCPIAKGPADITYDIKLASILPPVLGSASFHLTAKNQRGSDIVCVKAHLGIQAEDSAEAADAFMSALKTLPPAVPAEDGANGRQLSLTWSDCNPKSHAPITDFGPNMITLGQKTTMTGHGNLDEAVTSANFDLLMKGFAGVTLLHCNGDASQSKTCRLPMNTGSLTFNAMTFPISVGKVPVNVDINLLSALPPQLARTTVTSRATDQNGEELFCIEIKSAPAADRAVVV